LGPTTGGPAGPATPGPAGPTTPGPPGPMAPGPAGPTGSGPATPGPRGPATGIPSPAAIRYRCREYKRVRACEPCVVGRDPNCEMTLPECEAVCHEAARTGFAIYSRTARQVPLVFLPNGPAPAAAKVIRSHMATHDTEIHAYPGHGHLCTCSTGHNWLQRGSHKCGCHSTGMMSVPRNHAEPGLHEDAPRNSLRSRSSRGLHTVAAPFVQGPARDLAPKRQFSEIRSTKSSTSEYSTPMEARTTSSVGALREAGYSRSSRDGYHPELASGSSANALASATATFGCGCALAVWPWCCVQIRSDTGQAGPLTYSHYYILLIDCDGSETRLELTPQRPEDLKPAEFAAAGGVPSWSRVGPADSMIYRNLVRPFTGSLEWEGCYDCEVSEEGCLEAWSDVCACVEDTAEDYSRAPLGKQKVAWSPLGPNSNTFVWYVAVVCGLGPIKWRRNATGSPGASRPSAYPDRLFPGGRNPAGH
jgi:hypothetical protein